MPITYDFPNNGKGANFTRYPGVASYRDGRGNGPHLGVLSFPLPLAIALAGTDLVGINIFLKTGTSPDFVYTLLETRGTYGVDGFIEYFYFMLSAVSGEAYAVNWTRADGTRTPEPPVDGEPYFPGVPHREEIMANSATLLREHVRRAFLVERKTGERAILLRRKIQGERCSCWNTRLRDGPRACPSCYGTGFDGGYDVFPKILLRFHPAGTRLHLDEAGIMVDSSPKGHTLIVPEVTDRDMIVRLLPQNRLRAYEVHNSVRKSLEGPAGIPVLQEFSLKVMERSEPVYDAVRELIPSSLLPAEAMIEPGLPID